MNERGVATRRKIQQWCFNDIMFPTDLVFKFVTRNYTHDVEIMRCGLAHNGTLFNRRQQFSAKDGTFKSSTFESYCNGKMTELHFRSSGYMHIDVDMDRYDDYGKWKGNSVVIMMTIILIRTSISVTTRWRIGLVVGYDLGSVAVKRRVVMYVTRYLLTQLKSI